MKVRVELCWCGNDKFKFLCEIQTGPHKGDRYFINAADGENWTRAHSSRLRDHLTRTYHVKRNSIVVV